MVIILIKRKYIIFSCFLVFFMLLGVLLLTHPENTEVSITGSFTKTVVLDAGHGYPDGGAEGTTKVTEEAINLDVTKKLQKLLEKSGISVILTRADENGIFDEGLKTIRKKKVSDMKNREKIINSSGADYFISIHMNKFTDSKYSGPQVFYNSDFDEGKLLAESIQKELIAELKPKMEREIKKSDKNIYLLKNSNIPAVLIECGFLSNPQEEKLLLTEEYKEKIAWAIYKGIISNFQMNR